MESRVHDWITGRLATGRALYAVLLDPDAAEPAESARLAEMVTLAGADLVLVGGSLSLRGGIDETVRAVKGSTDLPVLMFPGGLAFMVPSADAVLFLSLISGRNAELLIGEQVKAAPLLKKHGIEAIPTAYLLVEGGATTSVEFMSGTKPLPRGKPDIAAAHALAGQYLGMRLAFLDAGSGAPNPVPTDIIEAVSGTVEIPLFVGGGIRTPLGAREAVSAGAGVVVTGDIVEKTRDAGLVREMAEAVHGD